MAELGQISVKVTSDTSDYASGLKKAKEETSSFSDLASGALMGVGMAGVNMAISAVGSFASFASGGISMASDLNETISKVGVVFGDNAKAVNEWGKNAATALGQTQSEALAAAGTFGNLFVSMGMAKGPSADMSMNLVQLATDLASFNNIDPQVALEKLRAGMLGQSEPMQALGVNMTAASVTAKALSMGLAATAKELTPAMLAQARYAIILEQTKTAQGDFAKTSDGLANQQRVANAQWKELQTTLGTALLPVMVSVTSALNKLMKDVLPPLAAFITGTVTPAMQSISDAIGPGITAAIAWFKSLGTTMQGTADGPMSYLKTWFTENMPRIQLIVSTVVTALTGFWRDHGTQIMGIVGPLLKWITKFFETDMKTILDLVTAALQLLTGDFSGAGTTLKGILARWKDFIGASITAITTGMVTAFKSVDWAGVGSGLMHGLANGITSGGSYIADAAKNAAKSAVDSAKDLLGIHSDSKVGIEIGANFSRAMGVGAAVGAPDLAAMGGLDRMMGRTVGGLAPAAPQAAGGIQFVQNFYGNADAPTVRSAANDGLLSALRAAGVAA